MRRVQAESCAIPETTVVLHICPNPCLDHPSSSCLPLCAFTGDKPAICLCWSLRLSHGRSLDSPYAVPSLTTLASRFCLMSSMNGSGKVGTEVWPHFNSVSARWDACGRCGKLPEQGMEEGLCISWCCKNVAIISMITGSGSISAFPDSCLQPSPTNEE